MMINPELSALLLVASSVHTEQIPLQDQTYYCELTNHMTVSQRDNAFNLFKVSKR